MTYYSNVRTFCVASTLYIALLLFVITVISNIKLNLIGILKSIVSLLLHLFPLKEFRHGDGKWVDDGIK